MFDQAHISIYSPSFDFPFPFWTYNDKPDMKLLCQNFSKILKPNNLECVYYSEINRQIVLSQPLEKNQTSAPIGVQRDKKGKEMFLTLKKTKYFDSSFYYRTKGEIVLNNYSYNNNYGFFPNGLNFNFWGRKSVLNYDNLISQANKNQFSQKLISTDTIKLDLTFDSSTCSGVVIPRFKTRTIANDKILTTEQIVEYDTTYSLCINKTNLSLFYRFGESIYKNSSGYMDSLNMPIYAVGQSLKKSGFWSFFSSYDTTKFLVTGFLKLKTDSVFRHSQVKFKYDTIISYR